MSLPSNYICQTPRDIIEETFPPPHLRRSTAFADSAIPSLSSPNSSSTPVLHVSPSHNPTFAPSNYNSIHQSFAVTMATAMLGTGSRVARGHQSATDHQHLCFKLNVSNQFCIDYGTDLDDCMIFVSWL